MKRHLGKHEVMARLFKDDVLERFENYAAFKSDGRKVRFHTIRELIDSNQIHDAAPNIGAPYEIVNQLGQISDAIRNFRRTAATTEPKYLVIRLEAKGGRLVGEVVDRLTTQGAATDAAAAKQETVTDCESVVYITTPVGATLLGSTWS